MHKKIIDIINANGTMSAEDVARCETYFEEIIKPRNTIVEEQDRKPQYLYFINEGFMRLFYYDENGDEVTTLIAPPSNFIASFINLIHQKPSNENVECITDCKILRIERANLIKLIEYGEVFKQFSLMIFEQALKSGQIRANDFATLTAELRYKKLMDEQPEILKNVPIQYIASYLGIKPQSLSRIRKQLIK